MEGSCNEQGGADSLANDWRKQHEPDLRERVIYAIVGKLRICAPAVSKNDIKKTAIKFEDKIYGQAKDKDDYFRKINRKVVECYRKFGIVSSDNGGAHTTPEPVQGQWLQQNNIQSNLNTPDSSGLPPQVPITVSAPQNLNIQMGGDQEVHSNLLPSPQREIQGRPQSFRTMFQHQMDNTQRFQAADSLHQSQNQQNPSSTSGGGDWREETYHKIKTLKEKHVHVLNTMFQTFSDRLPETDSLHQQNIPQEQVKKMRTSKEVLEKILEFLNVSRGSVTETHRDRFSKCETYVLKFTEFYQRKMHLPPSQIHQSGQEHVSHSLESSDQMSSRLMPSHQNVASSSPNANQILTESQEHPPLVTLLPEAISERPIDRLIKAIQSSSPESLAQSVSEMSSVISLSDMLAVSVHTIGGSRACLGEDLSERTRLRMQQVTAIPLDSTASSASNVNKIKPGYALLQEINEINGRLVETVVSICNEDVCHQSEATSGTVVMCSYEPVALSATFKALYNSRHISQIQPLRLLVPENYPCSPILVENVLFDIASVHKYEDLSGRARSRFGLSIKEYSEAMSLTEIAKVWDECGRATMAEYAERHGGGTFSSKYGRWESVQR